MISWRERAYYNFVRNFNRNKTHLLNNQSHNFIKKDTGIQNKSFFKQCYSRKNVSLGLNSLRKMQIKVIYHLLTLEIESIIQLHGKSRINSINI